MLNLGFFFSSSLFWKFVIEENMIKRDKFVSMMDLIFFPIDGKDQGYIIEISLESYDFSFH